MIKKIILDGFKSFGKRTELAFNNGFNCILGPNGAGKSNVTDALCFVFGRLSSKSLRAEKTANLIFNGGKKGKPASKAEVSVILDNSTKIFPFDVDEIKISRIVKQSGQTIYKINDKKKTRQEVLELLNLAKINPDGYNIILQGDIVKFVEMSTLERRKIIEEIAGIQIYEEKKEKSLKELEKVEQKLKEADIILAERKTYMQELKRDRDQAMKYKEMKDNIESFKASYLFINIEKKKKQEENIREKLNNEERKKKEVTIKIEKAKEEIEENKRKLEEINKEIEAKSERDQLNLQKEVESLRVKIATDKTKAENIKNELSRIQQREVQLNSDLKDIEKSLKELERKKQEIKTRIEKKNKEIKFIESEVVKFKKKHNIEEIPNLEQELEKIDTNIENLQTELNKLNEKKQELLRNKDRLELQIKTVDERLKKIAAIEKENKEQLQLVKEKKKELEETSKKLTELADKDSKLSLEIKKLKEKIAAVETELRVIKNENLLRKDKIMRNKAIEEILKLKTKKKGIYGTIADLAEVDKKYALAIEIAAGPKINSIIVETDSIAIDCINHLKKNRLGIATFLPLNKIKPFEISEDIKKLLKEKGVIGLAIDLISFDSRFRNAFSNVFKDTVIVDKIETAKRIGIGKARFVSLDGDLAEPSGVIQGGFREKKVSAFANIKKETELLQELNNKNKELEELTKQKEGIQEEITKLRESKALMEAELIKLERSLFIEDADLEATKRTKEKFIQDLKIVEEDLMSIEEKVRDIIRNIAELKAKRQDLKEKISKIRVPVLLAELNAFEEKKKQVEREIIELNNDLKNISTKINEILLPDKNNIIKILKQLKKEKENFQEELKKLEESLTNNEKILKDKEKLQKEFYAKFKDLFIKRDKVEDNIKEIERKLDSLKELDRKIELELNTLTIEHAKIKAELAALQKEFEFYKDKNVKIIKDKTESELKKEIDKFEKMLENLGAINLKALEVYEKAAKEFNELLEKKEKLQKEKEDVLKMMQEIETKKKELFLNTFNKINEQFSKYFKMLSKKGEASLLLENEKEPFEAGVEIKVKITNNKYLDIRSLSGGEKTITALAFIFSIQEYEPARFYVFDEVDASLDKENSEKLAKLLRDFSKKAQYIIVSHNDAVISEAEILYGISMDENNISKAVSLKV